MDFTKLTDQEVIVVLDVSCNLRNKISEELNDNERECIADIYSDLEDRITELYRECSTRKINLND